MFIHASTRAAKTRAMEYDRAVAMARLNGNNDQGRIVIGQLGQSLDGRIATPTGASKYINGRDALGHLHRIRANVDAVIVGIGTAIADDPQLTTRHVRGPNPARVIIDPNGRTPEDLRMLSDGAAPVHVITTAAGGGRTLPGRIVLDADATGNIDPRAILDALAERGMRRILVEGGAETLARFLDAGAVDELHLLLAPIVLGSGKTGLNLAPIETLEQALRPLVRIMRFGDGDMLCMCEFRPRDGEEQALGRSIGATGA